MKNRRRRDRACLRPARRAGARSAARRPAAGLAVKPLAAGLGYDYLSRTVVWSGDEADSKLTSTMLVTARAEFGSRPRASIVGLTAGFSFSDVSRARLRRPAHQPPATTGRPSRASSSGPMSWSRSTKFGDFEMKARGPDRLFFRDVQDLAARRLRRRGRGRGQAELDGGRRRARASTTSSSAGSSPTSS
ncbi:MAG: hypothetical protein M0C28_04405 [Candidatus Moduliflexus flocculans]|nr:hypothetical protein [Candidatus Moduliflexus flocculans]